MAERLLMIAPMPNVHAANDATEVCVGDVLAGRYVLLEVIGEGSCGVVYRARQRELGRDVAVKVLCRSTPQTTGRFEREWNITARLRHPNTIRLFDCGRTAGGHPYIVTELLHGRSLAAVIAEGPIPLERAALIALQVVGPLAEAHDAGIFHRDIKPDNIFLDHVGGEDFVKVIDFGIAHDGSAARLTRPGFVIGTPAYISPEQALGKEIDERADIYSLGVVLYEMLSGEPPFQGVSGMQTIWMHVAQPAPALKSFGQTWAGTLMARLVRSMLQKEPEDRPASMAEVRRSLESIVDELRVVDDHTTLDLEHPLVVATVARG